MSYHDPYRREDGRVHGIADQQVNSGMPCLRGVDGSANMGNGTRFNGWWIDASGAQNGAVSGNHSGPALADGYDPDCYEIPASQFVAPRVQLQGPRHQNGQAANAAAAAPDAFDFNNSEQPLPWNAGNERSKLHDAPIPVRRFTKCADDELLEYLRKRNIDPGFLHEIDLFLQGHPEIASCPEGRDMLRNLSTLSPLDAYRYFLKGYTRPARYIDGIIKKEYFQLDRATFLYCPQGKKYDPELDDFFRGYDYRYDILAKIDEEVLMGTQKLEYGRDVRISLRKLICYAVFGHPVDAYKYYEYCYQREFAPHQYLPDHVILGHVAKADGYTEPRACDFGYNKKHWAVRLRMARAQDQRVDVLNVLLAEYKIAILRKGYRRVTIDKLCADANDRLNEERRNPTGADIVDMIMDDATDRHPQPSRRRPALPNTHSRAHATFSFGTTQIRFRNARRRVPFQRVPGFLQVQATQLRQAKTSLTRLYMQEAEATYAQAAGARPDLNIIRSARAKAEQRFVEHLIKYLRDANRMDRYQATFLQEQFTREKMADTGASYQNYLLSMYPQELN